MAAYFFDSSALVKAYVQEAGSSWIRSIVDPVAGHELLISHITVVEVHSAIARRLRGGSLSQAEAARIRGDFASDAVTGYFILKLSEELINAAAKIAERYALRAVDSVQLTTLLAFNRDRKNIGLQAGTLVSADQELNAAATSEGISVEDPTAHP